MFVQTYNSLKGLWSLANDLIVRIANGASDRRQVPRFQSPQAAAEYLMKRAIYTGDPGNGALDFYMNPERLQYAMEIGPSAFRGLSVDCDDFATWAFAACRNMGVEAKIITIRCRLDVSRPWEEKNWGHHVLLIGATAVVGEHQGKFFAIDTNGYRELPNLNDATILAEWSRIYQGRGYVYEEVIPTPYPFS